MGGQMQNGGPDGGLPAPRRSGRLFGHLRLATHRGEEVREADSRHSCWHLLESEEEIAAATARALECERERQALLQASAARYEASLRAVLFRGGTDVPRAS